MKPLLLALALVFVAPIGCIGVWPLNFWDEPKPTETPRRQYRHRDEPRRSALAAAITDAWQARVFDKPNRWKRSREACAGRSGDVTCDVLAKKHRKAERKARRKAERKKRCGKKCRRRARREAKR